MLTRPGKNATRQRVHDRIRKKLQGTAERPRLNVYRSLNHIYVQVIDDLHGVTLVSASTAEGKKAKKHRRQRGCREGRRQDDRRARQGERDHEGGVRPRRVLYHGRVKALADAAREGGLAVLTDGIGIMDDPKN